MVGRGKSKTRFEPPTAASSKRSATSRETLNGSVSPRQSQAAHKKKNLSFDKFFLNGRDDTIRTCDPFVPSEVRYQAALHPDNTVFGVRDYLMINKQLCQE